MIQKIVPAVKYLVDGQCVFARSFQEAKETATQWRKMLDAHKPATKYLVDGQCVFARSLQEAKETVAKGWKSQFA